MGFIELESWLQIPLSPLEKSMLTVLLGATAGARGGQRQVTSSARRGQGKGTGGKVQCAVLKGSWGKGSREPSSYLGVGAGWIFTAAVRGIS